MTICSTPGWYCSHPRYCIPRDVGRDGMGPVEFPVLHVVPSALELRHDPAAALVDREDLVARAVRDEDVRSRVRVDREDEPRRERDDTLKQVAVRQADP